MQFPWQINIGGMHLPLHPVLETAGMFIGFRYFLWLRSRNPDPIGSSNRTWILIGAIFGSVIGSRLIGGLEDPQALIHSSNILWHFYINKTILGGLLGGLAGVEITKKNIHENTASGDLFTFPLILAIIIGRIGCFSMGIYETTYGTPTNNIFGIDLGDGQLRHPVTLYEIAFLLLLWIFLYQLKKHNTLVNGAIFKIFMIAYLIFRLLLDFIKPHYTFSIGLSTIQITCIIGLMYYVRFIIQPKQLLVSHA